MIKNILKGERGTFELTWFDSADFSTLNPITQIYGVLFGKEEKILIVNPAGNWQLPCGKPEKGETFEQTLIREANEEGDVDITNIFPLGYQKVYHKEVNSTIYQLRYIADISKIKKQTIDPANGKIPKRKFIFPENFLKYCPWGNIGNYMIKKALEIHKTINKFGKEQNL